MGFFADLFLGEKCKFCGSRSVKDHNTFLNSSNIRMKWCTSCKRVYIDETGHVPRCRVCGTRQTATGRNSNNVILPKCPKCGYVYDNYEYGE